MEFHGIPWNFGGANFADTSSSMEFHGTWSVPISLTRAVPWNSMELTMRQFCWHEQFHGIPWNSLELWVRQFRWHEQFHGIPWNFGCANFDDTSSSMEFHEIPWNLECANFADTSSPMNSMEFHGIWSAPILLTWEAPWNSMELWVRQFRWHEQFHGIPWNLECANFADTSSSMEFHGTWNAPISLTRAVPWNSMEIEVRQFRSYEKFHGIPWNSMELWVRQFRWHEQFHGIPRNLECANFANTSSSMEFHGTGTAPISMTWAVPWNSMELWVRQFRWHEQFHGIPWNLECANFADTSSSMEFHGIPWN